MARFCDKCLPDKCAWAFYVVQSVAGYDGFNGNEWKDEFWTCDLHKIGIPTAWRTLTQGEWKCWRIEQIQKETPGWKPPTNWA